MKCALGFESFSVLKNKALFDKNRRFLIYIRILNVFKDKLRDVGKKFKTGTATIHFDA